MAKTTKSLQDLTARVRAHQAKSAGEVDPNASAAPAVKLTDGDDAYKLGIPAGAKPQNVDAGGTSTLGLSATKPSGTGENVPSPAVTTSATDTPLGKAAMLVERLKETMHAQNIQPTAVEQRTKAADDVSLSAEMLTKLGQAMVATEEGRSLAESYLAKQAGIEAARNLIKSACDEQTNATLYAQQHEHLVKQAFAEIQQDNAEIVAQLQGASPEEIVSFDKLAAAHAERLNCFGDPELVMFYKMGALDAAAMQEGMGEGAPPEAALPGAEGPLTLEQIAGLLDAMVQAGEIEPAVAAEVLQGLMGGEGGAAADPAAAAVDPAAEEMPPEEAVKEASVANAIYSQLLYDLQ